MTSKDWAWKIVNHTCSRLPCCKDTPCGNAIALVEEIFVAGTSALNRSLQPGEFERGVEAMRHETVRQLVVLLSSTPTPLMKVRDAAIRAAIETVRDLKVEP